VQPVSGGSLVTEVGVNGSGQPAQPGRQAGEVALLWVLPGEIGEIGQVRGEPVEERARRDGAVGSFMLSGNLGSLVYLGGRQDMPQIDVHPATDLIKPEENGNGGRH
jgi:hypothetical protein